MKNPETCASMDPRWQPTELVSTLLSKGARDVVWHWISQKWFLDDDNQPKSLSFGGTDGDEFNCLINQVGPHLAAAVIGNELLRKGIAEQHDNGSLLLRRSAYVAGSAQVEDWLFNSEERLVCGGHFRRQSD